MAVINDFMQPRDQLDKLSNTIEGVMKCALTMAEDMQSDEVDEDKSAGYINTIEQYLLDFARLSEDISLRQKAIDQLQASSSCVREDQEPLDLSEEFVTCLERLKAAQKDSYDPLTHPIVVDFKEQILNSLEEEEMSGDHNPAQDDEECDLVVGQVDKSLKCPLTKVFYEKPVTSKMCKHSYSQEAIIAHIKRSRGPMAKCPVCGSLLKEDDLVRDKKLERMVKKAKKQKEVTHTSVVNL